MRWYLLTFMTAAIVMAGLLRLSNLPALIAEAAVLALGFYVGLLGIWSHTRGVRRTAASIVSSR